ncbi:unnamed protein product [Clonostachys rosea f. rosea IK726]|uniref:Uncharacterized protein n=1 Tax=Clonostachys rosea f. rosea IK726 TaxID=1349383 RepID=A0ACA9UCF5_BIOOC|nr:unnamed protein product [Clonostachys rosea f. rosea IK726]
MAEVLATWSPKHVYERGIPTDELVELYRRRHDHHSGLSLRGERFEKFTELATAAKADGSLIVAQITHPGRQVRESVSPTSVSASAVQLEPKDGMTFGKPHAATRAEMKKIVDEFAYAAERVRRPDHGEPHAFLSDIVRGVKARVSPKFIVSAKLNSVEFQEGGVTPDEAREVCETLEKLGLDFVELSGGTYEELGLKFERESTKIREGFFLKFA